MDGSEQLLRRLAAADETALKDIISPEWSRQPALDRRTRALVELSSLLAADAATSSMRWSVERAMTIGVEDAAMIQVLLSAASAVGTGQTVASAPRLGLALGLDIEVDGWDGT